MKPKVEEVAKDDPDPLVRQIASQIVGKLK
jgi:hypothetical protein